MLGVDETAFLKATPTSPTRFATGLVDLRPAGGGPARLLDVVEGRSGRVLSDWIDAQGEAFTRGVQVAALDPFRGYHTALTSRLEYATAVLDPFHVVRLLTSAADEVRRRVQNDPLGHRGRKGDPLYGIRRVLLRGAERHTPASWARLLAGVDVGDSGGQLAQVWIALQDLRHVYGAVSTGQARHRLHRFYWRCATAGVPELTRVARTISAWQDELLAYFTTGGASNGPTEAVNLLIKRTKRVSASGSATSPSTGCGYCCTAAPPGTIGPQHGSEDANHVLRRGAGLPDGLSAGVGSYLTADRQASTNRLRNLPSELMASDTSPCLKR